MPAATQALVRHEECGIRLPDGWVRSDKPADSAVLHAMQSCGTRQNKER
ncbi:hypothetical protein ACQPW1_20785 [Nocardia sp. CA-128927]